MNTLRLILLLVFIPLFSFQSSGKKVTSSSTALSVLFVGNSLTYSNNLPELVKKEAAIKGVTLHYKTLALPNYALIDHWNQGTLQKEIKSKAYQWVVVQQGPSSQPYGREVLMEYGTKIDALCKENKAQLAFFMVWPSLTHYQTFEGVITNYTDAATHTDALLLPVGKYWKAHFDETHNFDYYAEDGFHPSEKGSQAAAKIIVNHLLNLN